MDFWHSDFWVTGFWVTDFWVESAGGGGGPGPGGVLSGTVSFVPVLSGTTAAEPVLVGTPDVVSRVSATEAEFVPPLSGDVSVIPDD